MAPALPFITAGAALLGAGSSLAQTVKGPPDAPGGPINDGVMNASLQAPPPLNLGNLGGIQPPQMPALQQSPAPWGGLGQV